MLLDGELLSSQCSDVREDRRGRFAQSQVFGNATVIPHSLITLLKSTSPDPSLKDRSRAGRQSEPSQNFTISAE